MLEHDAVRRGGLGHDVPTDEPVFVTEGLKPIKAQGKRKEGPHELWREARRQ